MPKSKKSARRPKSSAASPPSSAEVSALVPVRKDRTQYSIGPLDGIMLHEDAQSDSPPNLTPNPNLNPSSPPRSSPALNSTPAIGSATAGQPSTLNLFYSAPGLWLYHNNCLEVLDAIFSHYPEGRFDMIFADPPYFLSNGGITCHAGRMVSVHKGDWDQSRGWAWNHEFNTEWLRRCQRVLKPNGTLWVTGTHHVIFSVGFALQQLGFKLLNDIAWEKPNPPPNLSCRYFTHSTETILWAAKNEKSKHVFNYQDMRKVTGKQMKTVWRKEEFEVGSSRCDDRASHRDAIPAGETDEERSAQRADPTNESDHQLSPIWTMTAPGNAEKSHGKHPTQKPVALVERCILASTHPGDLILDPFLGGGTTAVACIRLGRNFVGVELDLTHLTLATRRADAEIITLWLRHFRVEIRISILGRDGMLPSLNLGRQHGDPPLGKNDLDLFSNLIDRSDLMSDKPEPQTDRIFHETKFVFLSCAVVSSASVVHTTVDISLTEAWAHAPTGKKRETTHIVRCETEILRVRPGT